MKRCLVLNAGLVLLVFSCVASAQDEPSDDWVKVRFSKSATDRRLMDKDATLVFDDSARKLIVKNKERPLDIGYDDVQKVVFDMSTRMRGGMSQMAGGPGGSRDCQHAR